MVTLKDLYWAAGFIEGEGSFILHGQEHRRNHAVIQVAQVQKEPLDRLKTMFGGSMSLTVHQGKKRSDIWRWQLNGSKAAGVMMTLYAIMSPRRKEQIKKVLRVWQAGPIAFKYRTHCAKGHEYIEGNIYREPKRPTCRQCVTCRKERKVQASAKRRETKNTVSFDN